VKYFFLGLASAGRMMGSSSSSRKFRDTSCSGSWSAGLKSCSSSWLSPLSKTKFRSLSKGGGALAFSSQRLVDYWKCAPCPYRKNENHCCLLPLLDADYWDSCHWDCSLQRKNHCLDRCAWRPRSFGESSWWHRQLVKFSSNSFFCWV